MNKKFIILLLSGWMLVGFGLEARATTALATTTVKTEMGSFGKNKKKKRKKYKGYKKPRSKKFLGIFKRKSSCGCPGTSGSDHYDTVKPRKFRGFFCG